MKKTVSVLLALFLLSALCVPTFAADYTFIVDAGEVLSDLIEKAELPRVVDGAGLLTAAQIADLEAKINTVIFRQKCDVVIVTTDSLGGKSATAYADDFYDHNGYGQGAKNDGILFLISMEDRDWAISTCGYGITAFTDYGQELIIKAIRSDLSNDNFYTAFDGFVSKCDELLSAARAGTPVDVEDDSAGYKKLVLGPVGIILALVVGFLIAGIPMRKLKDEINNVKWKNTAADYTRPGSMALTQQYDNFLYANTTRTVIETDSSRSGGSSHGGSSTHTSSSGVSHGGSSGKF